MPQSSTGGQEMRRYPHLSAAIVLVSASLFGSGCAHTQQNLRIDAVPTSEVVLDADLITATIHDDGSVTSEVRSLPEMFAEAGDYLSAEDFENALRLYSTILESFDDPRYVRVTHYNAGLANEGLAQWELAAEHYSNVIEQWPETDDATYAYLRLGECYANLGRFEAIPALMEAVSVRSGLILEDRLEVELRWGNALLELRDLASAEEHYRRVISLNEAAERAWSPAAPDPLNLPLEVSNPIIAQSNFGIGRVYHELFSEIRLVLPEERLTRDLIDKGQLFDRAQAAYLDCVRSGNRYWGPAAGYMVGKLYEDFYYDVLATEVPHDFNELELEIYFEELRAFIQPSLERSLRIYEQNLAMAYRLGADNSWVDDTLAKIEEITVYIDEQNGWETEQQLIIEQRHPHSANFASRMNFRSELDRSRR
jgi:tetratricopeptide (TPR) repeat protein